MTTPTPAPSTAVARMRFVGKPRLKGKILTFTVAVPKAGSLSAGGARQALKASVKRR